MGHFFWQQKRSEEYSHAWILQIGNCLCICLFLYFCCGVERLATFFGELLLQIRGVILQYISYKPWLEYPPLVRSALLPLVSGVPLSPGGPYWVRFCWAIPLAIHSWCAVSRRVSDSVRDRHDVQILTQLCGWPPFCVGLEGWGGGREGVKEKTVI